MTKVTAGAAWARGELLLLASHSLGAGLPPILAVRRLRPPAMSYEEELRFKKERVCERCGASSSSPGNRRYCPGRACPLPRATKPIFAVGERDGEPLTGFFRPRSHDIVPVESCPAVPDAATARPTAVRAWMRTSQIRAYDEKGAARRPPRVCACSHMTGEIRSVSFPPKNCVPPTPMPGAERAGLPRIASLVLCDKNRATRRAPSVLLTLYGTDTNTDSLCSLRFAPLPPSFLFPGKSAQPRSATPGCICPYGRYEAVARPLLAAPAPSVLVSQNSPRMSSGRRSCRRPCKERPVEPEQNWLTNASSTARPVRGGPPTCAAGARGARPSSWGSAAEGAC
jgi:hypothetical protein